jgi:hypothetical protein
MQVSHSDVLTKARSQYHRSQTERILIQNTTTTQASTRQRHTVQELSERDKELMRLDPKQRQMLLALEALLGKKIAIVAFKEAHVAAPAPNSALPTVIYTQMQEEASSLDISFTGTLQTTKGKQIDFSLSIQWSEAFTTHQRDILQGGGDFSDPLVISLDGRQPIMKETFDFALTENASTLNYLSPNAGYLALDKDGNATIDKGSELFGPQSGDGFEELRAYDEDKNGWIDSSNSVYAQLKFWKISEGKNELKRLEEVGIGAISTPIAHYKEASIAVGENGRTYGVFSVDLAT